MKRPVELGNGENNEGKRRMLPHEEGGVVKEYEAMLEEDFWSSWLREDERGKEETMAKTERCEQRKREEEKEECEICEACVSVEACEIFESRERFKELW